MSFQSQSFDQFQNFALKSKPQTDFLRTQGSQMNQQMQTPNADYMGRTNQFSQAQNMQQRGNFQGQSKSFIYGQQTVSKEKKEELLSASTKKNLEQVLANSQGSRLHATVIEQEDLLQNEEKTLKNLMKVKNLFNKQKEDLVQQTFIAKNTILDLEGTNEGIQKYIDVLNENIKKNQEQIREAQISYQLDIEKYKKELFNANMQKDQTFKTATEMEIRLDQVLKDYVDVQSVVQSLETKVGNNEQYDKAIERFRQKQLAEKNKELDKLKKELEDTNTKLQDTEQTERLNQKIIQIQEELKINKAKADKLETELNWEKQNRDKVVNQRLDFYRMGELAGIQSNMDDYKKSIEFFKSNFIQKEQDFIALVQQSKKQEAQINVLSDKIKYQEEQHNELFKKQTTNVAIIKENKFLITHLESKLELLTQQKEEFLQKIKVAEQQTQEIDHQLEQITKTNEFNEAMNSLDDTQLKMIVKQNSEINQMLENFVNKVDAANKKLKE